MTLARRRVLGKEWGVREDQRVDDTAELVACHARDRAKRTGERPAGRGGVR